MKLTKEQLKEAIATLYNGLSEGMTDKEVFEEMGITAEDYKALKISMLEGKAEELRSKPHEHTYVEYLISQSANIRDLTSIIDKMDSKEQYASMVGAVRARADILDRLIEKGQAFGLIHKKAERKEIVAGVVVSELSDPQLKKLILGELSMLNDLRKQFGEKNFSKIEVPDELHTGPALVEEPKSKEDVGVFKKEDLPKTNKAKTSKISKGRKKIRKPSPIIDI